MLGIKPENLDINDNEIPVIFAKEEKNIYYFNGKEDFITPKEEIPNFHAFVINENSTIEKIIIPNTNLQSKSINTDEPIITFISPIYDNLHPNSKNLLNSRGRLPARNIPQIVKNAYNHFNNSTSGGANQIAFQRDYIYYGLTPNTEIGHLNNNIREEFNYITISPNSYFNFIRDPKNPKIKENEFSVNKKPVSTDEQIRRMWSDGVYKFNIYNLTSNDSRPEMLSFELRPEDIWNFNIEYNRRHGSFWRPSRHTYKIDPRKFTSKTINLANTANRVVFEKWNWDLSKESLHRRLKLVQHNESRSYEETKHYEQSFVKESKFNSGKAKFKIGPIEFGESPSVNINSTNTRKESTTIVVKGNYGDIELGEITTYFYDPVVINSRYDLYKYSFGSVQFSMVPR